MKHYPPLPERTVCSESITSRPWTGPVTKKRVPTPQIREASFDDYAQITSLQSEYGLPPKPFEEWKHLWVNNPAQMQAKLPIGWVLVSPEQHIVGYLGNIPLFYEFQGEILLASVAHAWVVDARYRTYALQLLDRYFSQREVELFLNATVGPKACESFAVFQSSPAPVGDWDRSSFWVTNYQQFVAGWLTMKGLSLAKPVSYVFSIGSLVTGALRKEVQSSKFLNLQLQFCSAIDSRFDCFWDAVRTLNHSVLLGERSRTALEWHFNYAIAGNKAWIIVATQGRSIIAYSIFFRHDNESFGLKRIRLVDFQTLDGNIAVLTPMLNLALQRCRREGINMLECIGFGPDKRNLITKLARYERKLPSWLYFYKARDKSLADSLREPTAWDPCQFDGDASL